MILQQSSCGTYAQQFAGIMVVPLPRPPGCTLLKHKSSELKDMVLSVRVQRSGGMEELAALLCTQRPRKLVLSSPMALSSRDVQRMTDVAFRYCEDVSVVGSYANTHWGETFTVRVGGMVRSLHIMDSNPQGSMRNTNIIVYGNVDHLEMLSISGDCRVTIAGTLRPGVNVCIRARSLTINGFRVPVVEQPAPDATDRTFMFTSAPTPPSVPSVPPMPSPSVPPMPSVVPPLIPSVPLPLPNISMLPPPPPPMMPMAMPLMPPPPAFVPVDKVH